ncbi:hypothetical protein EDC96DRAFT_531474 [Choanephora cucurbitarum]|nr:hypothetical protein EDC96DRAFT_531474 [Choanephora cucurbitarum]
MVNLILLPVELQLNIFLRLETKDLIKCQCVHKSWVVLAQTIMYEHVELTSNRDVYYFIATISTSPFMPGQHVKKLNMKYSFVEAIERYKDGFGDHALWYAERLIERIAVFTPNLETLTTPIMSSQLWRTIRAVRTKGQWKLLKQLSWPEKNEGTEDYIQLIISLKDTIKDISIFPVIEQQNSPMHTDIFAALDQEFQLKMYHEMLNYLPQFTHLESVHIKVNQKIWLHQLDNCISSFPANAKSLSADFTFLELPAEVLQNSSIVANRTLSKLSFAVKSQSQNDFAYIMDKFTNLEDLQFIYSAPYPSFQPSLAFDVATYRQLACYLKTLRSFSIQNLSVGNLNRFIDILHDTITEGEMNINTVLTKTLHGVICYNASFQYNRDKPSNFVIKNLIKHDGSNRTAMVNLPYLYKRLNTLILIDEGTSLRQWGLYVPSAESVYQIDDILSNCTELKTLCMNNIKFAMPMSPVYNHSIKCVKVLNYSFNPLPLERLLAQLPNLKTLVLSELCVEAIENESPEFEINLQDKKLDKLIFYFSSTKHHSIKITTSTETLNFERSKFLRQTSKLDRPDTHIIVDYVKKICVESDSDDPLDVTL